MSQDDTTSFRTSISGNLIFRGLIVAMFLIIMALSGVVGNLFLSHISNIDKNIDDLNKEYGYMSYRMVRVETRLGLQQKENGQ